MTAATTPARAMLEKTLQEAVRRLALAGGWRYYHTHRSQHSPAGFPDVCIVRDGVLLFAELKRETGKLSDEQQAWLDDLRAAGVEVYVWRPSDLLTGAIAQRLRRLPKCTSCGAELPNEATRTCAACWLQERRRVTT